MTGSGRPSPEPLLKKEAPPAVLGGGEKSGNALEAANALNCRVWGIPAVLPTGIPGKRSESVFRGLSGIFPEFLPESASRTGGMAQNEQSSAGRIHHVMRCFSAKKCQEKRQKIVTNMTSLEP